ncbi:MAG TPA: TolC family protein [Saprospiraceae bacterium]|nr:TolC family protein [Saprospiraceae bacterium]
MNRLRNLWFGLMVVACFGLALNQGQAQNPDSLTALTYEGFLQMVKENHPLSVNANLLLDQAEANLQRSRGAFDPTLKFQVDQKNFDEKLYFDNSGGMLEMPTFSPIELKAAYLQSDGVFLNPENNLPAAGQALAGIKVKLLQGMMTDTRRTALRQAEVLSDLNAARRRELLNDLLLQAGIRFYDWMFRYNELIIREDALDLAQIRFEATREQFVQGDKPAVDTLEAYLQLQSRSFDLQKAKGQLIDVRFALSDFLWSDRGTPVLLSESVPAPEIDLDVNSPDIFVDGQLLLMDPPPNHPSLDIYRSKLEQLDLERRLKREYLKPKLNAEYNLLGDGTNFNPDAKAGESNFGALVNDNYKFGINFAFPIFLREARGNLALTDIKIDQTDLQFDNKQLSLANKFNSLQSQYLLIQDQLRTQRQMVVNYRALLEAERIKFDIGESSLFLINSREIKLIESQIKALEMDIKLRETGLKLQWAGGLLAN